MTDERKGDADVAAGPSNGRASESRDGDAAQSGASTPATVRESSGEKRRQAFLRQASLPALDDRKPTVIHRWLHAAEGAKTWEAFGALDSKALEEGYQNWKSDERPGVAQKISDEEAQAGEKQDPKTSSGDTGKAVDRSGDEVPSDSASKKENHLPPPNPDEELPVWRVPVLVDHLYEVDLRNSKMWSIFWKTKPFEVMRGTWFFDANKLSPCTDAVADELEKLYEAIQPWLPSYGDELKSSVAAGAAGEDKLKAAMTTLKGSYVIFLGPYLARIYSDDVSSRLTKTLWTAWSGAHGGGTLVARGYNVAQSLLKTRESSRQSTPRKSARKSEAAPKKDATPGHKSNLSQSSRVSEEMDVSDSAEAAKVDSSIQEQGTAKPPEASEGDQSTDAGQPAPPTVASEASDGIKNWMSSKLSSWSKASGATAASQQLPKKTQDDLKSAFQEAQTRAQGMLHERERKRIEKDIERDKSLAADTTDDQLTDPEDKHEDETGEDQEQELQKELDRENKPLDLVLVWHGIGQKIAEEWKSLDFTLAVTNLRNLTHKRAGHKPPTDVGGGGMPELSKDRRIQMLPVMWRATLEDFEPTSRDDDANPEEHLDNNFTIDDIFSDTMPIIKQLISGVLFDIPLYLSHHREEIMKRVIRENNRIFRLFLQRNPKFLENGGRVSLIAHSLGAALATDILSKQPTFASRQLPDPGRELAFDVHNLYFVGSPVALFMWINKAQLIARRGRELTQDAPVDEALDRHGRWGCLAVDRIFNVFSGSDPIGTRLNSTVDAALAKSLKSVALNRAVKSILRTMPDALPAPQSSSSTSLFGTWGSKTAGNKGSRPSSSAGPAEDVPDDGEGQFTKDNKSKERSARTSAFAEKWKTGKASKQPKGVDAMQKEAEGEAKKANGTKSETEKTNEKTPESSAEAETRSATEAKEMAHIPRPANDENRGERRIKALCEFGCVDFVIPSSASFLSNQYMDLLWSHASYWTEPTFADFVLATLNSSPDRLREASIKLKSEP